MDLLHIIFFFLLAIAILIASHEAGHYLVARWVGVHVVRFSIGFWEPSWAWRNARGTEFRIAAVPLGGYVRLYDRRDDDAASVAPADPALAQRSYDRLHPKWRIAIALGGPAANLLLALALYWVLGMVGVAVAPPAVAVAADSAAHRAGIRDGAEIVAVDGRETSTWTEVGMALIGRLGDSGEIAIETMREGRRQQHAIAIDAWHADSRDPDVLRSLGLAPLLPPYIGDVLADGPAHAAGLRADDRIVQVDGRSVAAWEDFVTVVRASPGVSLQLTVARAEGTRLVAVTPRREIDQDGTPYGYIGAVATRPKRIVRSGPIAALGGAFADTWNYGALTLRLIAKMALLEVSAKNVAGPITIAKVSSDTARAGATEFLALLALLSVNLGIINLLPVPVLDGGLVLRNAVEWVRRKPVSAGAAAMTDKVGFAMVAGLMALVCYAEAVRWFWPD